MGTYEDPWFPAKELCKEMGYQNINETVHTHKCQIWTSNEAIKFSELNKWIIIIITHSAAAAAASFFYCCYHGSFSIRELYRLITCRMIPNWEYYVYIIIIIINNNNNNIIY